MDKMLFTAMSGLKQLLLSQANNAHNLANVATTGFKAEMQHFIHKDVLGAGFPTRSYSVSEKTGINFDEGTHAHTGRDLDVAITGKGFLAVQSPSGDEAYTRAGSLQINANGLLSTSSGDLVLGNGGPVTIPPSSKIQIGKDGTVSIVPNGAPASALAVIDRLKLVKVDESKLVKQDDGLFHLNDGNTADAAADVTLVSGYLEGSNVNVIDAMVNMIEISRNYELQSKMMKSAKENDSTSTKLLTLS